jgi:hypothetical protein
MAPGVFSKYSNSSALVRAGTRVAVGAYDAEPSRQPQLPHTIHSAFESPEYLLQIVVFSLV